MDGMRILVLENDEDLLADILNTLLEFNHEASGAGTLDGLEVETLSPKRFDLIIVDGRMVDDEDSSDKSGEDFAVQLGAAGMPVVLLTAHLPPRAEVFRLLRTGKLVGVVSKEVLLGADFLAAVDQYIRTRKYPNGIGRFYGLPHEAPLEPTFWDSLVRDLIVMAPGLSASSPELRTLIRSLVSPCATRVDLEPVAPGQSGTGILRARVSCGDGPARELLAIKYGIRASILSESMRYDQHVGPLADGAAAQLRLRAETSSLGAIAYSWVGDSEEDGVALGPPGRRSNLSWRRRRSAVHRLFTVALRPWYEVYRSGRGRSEGPRKLIEYYTGESGLWYGEGQDLQNLFSAGVDPFMPIVLGDEAWDFGDHGGILPNPLSVLAGEACSQLRIERFCPCHGDLHVGNVFVLPDDSPRLIDFGKTDMGDLFRDFTALEVSLRLMFDQPATISQISLAEDLVSETQSLGDHIAYRTLGSGAADLVETIRTTTLIRRAALDAAGQYLPSCARIEYMIAVILHMLKYAQAGAEEADPEEDEQRKRVRTWHALYGAARTAKALAALEDD